MRVKLMYHTVKIVFVHYIWKFFALCKEPPASDHVLVCPICNGGN